MSASQWSQIVYETTIYIDFFTYNLWSVKNGAAGDPQKTQRVEFLAFFLAKYLGQINGISSPKLTLCRTENMVNLRL